MLYKFCCFYCTIFVIFNVLRLMVMSPVFFFGESFFLFFSFSFNKFMKFFWEFDLTVKVMGWSEMIFFLMLPRTKQNIYQNMTKCVWCVYVCGPRRCIKFEIYFDFFFSLRSICTCSVLKTSSSFSLRLGLCWQLTVEQWKCQV